MSTESARKAAERIFDEAYTANTNSAESDFDIDAAERIIAAACQTVAPPRECGMHAGMGCLDASCHHFLKYHDPKSDFYIGSECVNCCFGQVERERGAAPAVSTPRCPKCNASWIKRPDDFREWIHDGVYQIYCAACGGTYSLLHVAEFLQFFQPAPSPPPGTIIGETTERRCINLCRDLLKWAEETGNKFPLELGLRISNESRERTYSKVDENWGVASPQGESK